MRVNKFRILLDFFYRKKEDISLSNADMKISFKVGVKTIELNSFNGKINSLVYLENNKPSLELERIDFEGNLMQGYVALIRLLR